MDAKFLFIAISISVLFIGAFFISLSLIYKVSKKKRLSFLNTFIYEVVPSFSEKYSFINYLLFFGLTVCLFPYIYYVVYNVNTFAMTIMIIAVILMFCLASLPFVSLSKLREHYYLALGALVSLFALYVMEAYYSASLFFRFSSEDMQLVSFIVASVLGLFVLFIILNPKLFDLKNIRDDSGELVRKKVIFLALSEFLLYPLAILALLPMLLISL